MAIKFEGIPGEHGVPNYRYSRIQFKRLSVEGGLGHYVLDTKKLELRRFESIWNKVLFSITLLDGRSNSFSLPLFYTSDKPFSVVLHLCVKINAKHKALKAESSRSIWERNALT